MEASPKPSMEHYFCSATSALASCRTIITSFKAEAQPAAQLLFQSWQGKLLLFLVTQKPKLKVEILVPFPLLGLLSVRFSTESHLSTIPQGVNSPHTFSNFKLVDTSGLQHPQIIDCRK